MIKARNNGSIHHRQRHNQGIVYCLIVWAIHHVLAQICERAALHELVKRVNIAHVLEETCVVCQATASISVICSYLTEGEEGLNVVLRHEPGDDSRVEGPDLVHIGLVAAAEVL